VTTYRARVTSNHSQVEVFDYMARFSNVAAWDPGVAEATGSSEAPTLGSTYRLVVRTFGRSVPLEYRIAEFEPPHRVVLRAENSVVRSTDVIDVAPGPGDGSVLTYHATLGLKGVAVVLTPLLDHWFRRVGDRAMLGLRSVLAS
jgi:hypothetical protein